MVRTIEELGDAARVAVVLFEEGPLQERLVALGVKVHVQPLNPGVAHADRFAAARAGVTPRAAARIVSFAWQLARLLHTLDIDIVHSTSLKADLICVPASRLARRPLIWHVHDRVSDDYLPRSMVTLLRTLAGVAPASVIANSRATAATIPRARQLHVIPPGVPADWLRSDAAARPAPQQPVIGIVGRLSPTKGQHVFLDAAALLSASHPDVRFEIIGTAMFGQQAYADRLREQVDILGLGDRVTFRGFVSDPRDAYDRMTVCVHASTVPEPFGQVIAEAMARGVPVVATRGGGAVEIVEPPGETPTGLLVPLDDAAALADAVGRVLDDPEASRDRAVHAQRHVTDHLTAAVTAAAVTDLWDDVAHTRG